MVRQAYSAAAQSPAAEHAFPVGRLFAESAEGARVLDVGCGAGLDCAIAARRAGSHGRVAGLDFSMAMLARARCAHPGIIFCCAAAEQIPLPDSSVDLALANGIFNLNPQRTLIFHELARVLRPAGVLVAAELVLAQHILRQQLREVRDGERAPA